MPGPTIIRCSVPDCDWGFEITDYGRTDQCYRAYSKHCAKMHGADRESYIHFDLQKQETLPRRSERDRIHAEGAAAASQIELSTGPLADVQDSLTAAFLEDLSQKIVQRAFPRLSQ